VVAELLRVFPEAPVFTSVYDPGGVPETVRQWHVRPSILQRIPGVRRFSRLLLPLMPWAFARFDMSGFDVVITASSAFSKNVHAPRGVSNVCYCHTPPRYVWDLWDEYRKRIPASVLLTPIVWWLRRKDVAASRQVGRFIANSHFVAARIRRYYGRDAEVVHPPVDVDRIAAAKSRRGNAYIVVSRLVAYKRIDLAIAACTRLGRELIVIGRGPERKRLERIAGPTISFLGALPDEEVAERLASGRAFLFPGLEDFGIAPVEAQAAGLPVIAFGRGGALETVVDGATGLFFHEQTVDSLVDAMLRFENTDFDPSACRRHAERFAAPVFRARMAAIVAEAAANPTRT
jgi:glycosyltransferase involved in cell wall biosynthesis